MLSSVAEAPAEEKKDAETLSTHHDEKPWIYYGKDENAIGISQPLFNLGIVAVVTSLNKSTTAEAEGFVTHNTFTLDAIRYHFDERETIVRTVEGINEELSKTDQWVSELQALSCKKDPKSIFSESKNTMIIYRKKIISYVCYLPFNLCNNGIIRGLPNIVSLRIHPFASHSIKRPLQPFKKFVISFFMSGSSLKGLNSYGEEVSVLSDNIVLRKRKITHIFAFKPSFYEEAQFKEIELYILMMLQLGAENREVICNLHYIENLVFGIYAYFLGLFSFEILDNFLEKIIQRRDAIQQRLLLIFNHYGIKLSFLSSLDNLFIHKKQCPDRALAGLLLSDLELLRHQVNPFIDQNKILLSACLTQLENNTLFTQHLPVWENFLEVMRQDKKILSTINDFVKMADAVTLAIAAEGSLSGEVCSIEPASRKDIQEAEGYYTERANRNNSKKFTGYTQHTHKNFQRSVVDCSRPVRESYTKQSRANYPRLFFISVMDRFIANNLGDPTPHGIKKTGLPFYCKETKANTILKLVGNINFFKKTVTNGAYRKGDPEHTPLQKQTNSI